MASHLDLEEQEQLDQLKNFWKQYGNLITWTLIIVLGAFSGWTYWNNYQAGQAGKAGAMFDELDKAAQAGDADRAATVFATLKDRYPGTAFAEQAGMALAKVQFDKGQFDNARATLTWVIDHAPEDEYKTLARVRLAGILLDQKKFDDALKQLDGATGKDFEPIVNDRRGDILMAQGKKDDAKAAYQKAWKDMDPKVQYRGLVEAKLTALGAAPEPEKAASAAEGSK
ncbi:YfgM family protein [Piscinibacter terrae]|uniref:Ancillary SecYEG translocon subunit n=1 Tax=Piscinibacter terrae TaxID=2496871 RepID=A0A3N7JRF8_9BURK|nr:tetratricopeptide repeat protein [Albitalea terrae]RQP23589.1 outer membrane protein assembly factor BamD [Albitalea terrae]